MHNITLLTVTHFCKGIGLFQKVITFFAIPLDVFSFISQNTAQGKHVSWKFYTVQR